MSIEKRPVNQPNLEERVKELSQRIRVTKPIVIPKKAKINPLVKASSDFSMFTLNTKLPFGIFVFNRNAIFNQDQFSW
jgi:hypothetical protein